MAPSTKLKVCLFASVIALTLIFQNCSGSSSGSGADNGNTGQGETLTVEGAWSKGCEAFEEGSKKHELNIGSQSLSVQTSYFSDDACATLVSSVKHSGSFSPKIQNNLEGSLSMNLDAMSVQITEEKLLSAANESNTCSKTYELNEFVPSDCISDTPFTAIPVELTYKVETGSKLTLTVAQDIDEVRAGNYTRP